MLWFILDFGIAWIFVFMFIKPLRDADLELCLDWRRKKQGSNHSDRTSSYLMAGSILILLGLSNLWGTMGQSALSSLINLAPLP